MACSLLFVEIMYKIFTLIFIASLPFHSFGQTTVDTSMQNRPDTIIQNSTDTTMQNFGGEKIPVTQQIYKLRPASDIPVTLIGTGWSLYAFSKIYSKDKSSVEKILSLNKNNIPSFDRHGVSIYHPKAADASDLIFYGSMPFPVFLMLDKKIRKDGLKITLLYLESMAVTGLIYTGTVYLNDRYRPYAYNSAVDISERTRGGAKNSFFAGHVALVGTSTFFIAKILNDYHPASKVKWLPFTLAGLATATTGYLRYRGGQHFLSDIVSGAIVGTLSGILIPHVHKNKDITDRKLSFTAGYMGDTPQFGIVYKITK